MRRFFIHISIDDTNEYIHNFQKLLDVLSFDEKTTYEITIDVSNLKKLNTDVILELVKAEQEYGKAHKAIFKNTLSCQYYQLDRKIVRCILRHGLDVLIQYCGKIEKNKQLEKTIRKLQKKYIPHYLNVKCSPEDIYSNYENLKTTTCAFEIEDAIASDIDLVKEFDAWCMQENNCHTFKTFEDILYRLLLGYTHRDCRHSSCLGKRVCMKSNGELYFCHSYDKNTYLKNISEVKGFSDIYESKFFGSTLLTSLEKRNKCVECDNFAVCQSGCPLSSLNKSNECNETRYCELIQHIAKYLHEKLDIKHELPQNPIIRRIVLVSIAYKGKVEINTFYKGVK